MDEEASDVALWQQAMREIYGGRDDVEVARLTGISQPWINQIRNGRVPSRRTLITLVDVLGAPVETRTRVFTIAGYADPAAAIAEPRADYGTAGRLMRGIEEIARATGRAVELSLDDLQQPRATDSDVEKLLARIRQRNMT